MFKVFQISTLFAFVLAFVSIVQATCPDLGVATRECPALSAYDVACTGTNAADCVNDVMQEPKSDIWGTAYTPGRYVSEGAGSSALCYTEYQCKWDDDDNECVKDPEDYTEFFRAKNTVHQCGGTSTGAGI